MMYVYIYYEREGMRHFFSSPASLWRIQIIMGRFVFFLVFIEWTWYILERWKLYNNTQTNKTIFAWWIDRGVRIENLRNKKKMLCKLFDVSFARSAMKLLPKYSCSVLIFFELFSFHRTEELYWLLILFSPFKELACLVCSSPINGPTND